VTKAAAAQVRGLDEVEYVLNRMAQKYGHVIGVEIGVARREDDMLIFVDDRADPIVDEDSDILCCTLGEIASSAFLKLFAGRVNYAAIVQRFLEAERVQT